MPDSCQARRGTVPASSGVIGLARHWLLFLVNNWTQSQPQRRARSTAL